MAYHALSTPSELCSTHFSNISRRTCLNSNIGESSESCELHLDFLDALDFLGVRVTLFVTTSLVFNASEHIVSRALLREYQHRGHTIGSHTHDHIHLGDTGLMAAKLDVRRADEILTSLSISGERPRNFRAPFLATPGGNSKHEQELRHFLNHEMNYSQWGDIGGLVRGGMEWVAVRNDLKDWLYTELPFKEALEIAKDEARVVAEHFRRGVISAVICKHDRPHSLRNVETTVREICKVCQGCDFKALPSVGRSACVPNAVPSRRPPRNAPQRSHIHTTQSSSTHQEGHSYP